MTKGEWDLLLKVGCGGVRVGVRDSLMDMESNSKPSFKFLQTGKLRPSFSAHHQKAFKTMSMRILLGKKNMMRPVCGRI